MTIQVELNPELETRLAAAASAQGLAVEEYAQRLLQEAVEVHAPAHPHARVADLEAFFKAMASNKPIPAHLETDTFSREMIYGEHP